MRGDDIRAFAGCASKSYAIDIDVVDETGQVRLRGRQETKAKGVSRGIRKTIPYRQWECAVLNKIEYRVTQYNIMAKNHQIYTLAADKLALSPLDDKRWGDTRTSFIFPSSLIYFFLSQVRQSMRSAHRPLWLEIYPCDGAPAALHLLQTAKSGSVETETINILFVACLSVYINISSSPRSSPPSHERG